MLTRQQKQSLKNCHSPNEVADNLLRQLYQSSHFVALFDAIEFFVNEIADLNKKNTRITLFRRVSTFSQNYTLPKQFHSVTDYNAWKEDYKARKKQDVSATLLNACAHGADGLKTAEASLSADIRHFKAHKK